MNWLTSILVLIFALSITASIVILISILDDHYRYTCERFGPMLVSMVSLAIFCAYGLRMQQPAIYDPSLIAMIYSYISLFILALVNLYRYRPHDHW